ncbi:MAG: type II secretion system protein GspD, partial [Gammaproteobacteria bacterium]|nr:type II secretion system protein GspD [Gammaproteobacteria bacterium]
MSKFHLRHWLGASFICTLLVACTTPTGDRTALDKPWGKNRVSSSYDPVKLPSSNRPTDTLPPGLTPAPATTPTTRSEIYRGSGNFMRLGKA